VRHWATTLVDNQSQPALRWLRVAHAVGCLGLRKRCL